MLQIYRVTDGSLLYEIDHIGSLLQPVTTATGSERAARGLHDDDQTLLETSPSDRIEVELCCEIVDDISCVTKLAKQLRKIFTGIGLYTSPTVDNAVPRQLASARSYITQRSLHATMRDRALSFFSDDQT